MKKGDVFEITVRRFYTSDEAPVITPSTTNVIHVTHNDADTIMDSCGKLVRDCFEQIETATKELPFRGIRQMRDEEVTMLLADEEAMEEAEGMTRQ